MCLIFAPTATEEKGSRLSRTGREQSGEAQTRKARENQGGKKEGEREREKCTFVSLRLLPLGPRGEDQSIWGGDKIERK